MAMPQKKTVKISHALFHFLIVCLIGTTIVGCATNPARVPGTFEHTVSVQTRINHYFDEKVIGKLRTCWDRLEGEGTVAIGYTFVNDNKGNWIPQGIVAEESTLPKGQEVMAVRCMEKAVQNTSFSVSDLESDESHYDLHWNWPVPLPQEDLEPEALFLGQGGGIGLGCDGHGARAKCWNALGPPRPSKSKCIKVCVGYQNCREIRSCASGGFFGLVGGSMIGGSTP